MEKLYAVYGGRGQYHRRFTDGEILLKKGVARPISEEVAGILKDVKDVYFITEIDETPISLKKTLVKEAWDVLVKKHGIKKAKIVKEEQNERIRQAGDKEAEKENNGTGS